MVKKEETYTPPDPLAQAKAMIGQIKPAADYLFFPSLLAKRERAQIEDALKASIISKLSKEPSVANQTLHIGVPNGQAEDVYTFEVKVGYEGEKRVITVQTPMERIRGAYDEYMAQNVKA